MRHKDDLCVLIAFQEQPELTVKERYYSYAVVDVEAWNRVIDNDHRFICVLLLFFLSVEHIGKEIAQCNYIPLSHGNGVGSDGPAAWLDNVFVVLAFDFKPVFVKENISEVAVDDIDRYGYLLFFLFESFNFMTYPADLILCAFNFIIGSFHAAFLLQI